MLTASYRPVGGEWAPFGEPAPLAGVPNPKVGVYANDSNATVASRDDAVFEYFRLVPGLPGHDARRSTTHTLAPAAPDGQAGWYRSPVAVTLATEAGATTEYKVGDGAYAGRTPRRSRSATDGTHVVSYRSTDAAENVEAAKTVTVKVDRDRAEQRGDGDRRRAGDGHARGGRSGRRLGARRARVPARRRRVDGVRQRRSPSRAAGDHTLEHRATDVAGNVGAVGSEAFSIEGGGGPGAPTVQAFADPPAGPAPLAVTFSRRRARSRRRRADLPLGVRRRRRRSGRRVQRTLTTPGTHTATVTATDDEGETATDEVTVTVTAPGNDAAGDHRGDAPTGRPVPRRSRCGSRRWRRDPGRRPAHVPVGVRRRAGLGAGRRGGAHVPDAGRRTRRG